MTASALRLKAELVNVATLLTLPEVAVIVHEPAVEVVFASPALMLATPDGVQLAAH